MANNIGDFKNFHRALCERFNYPHDEEFWWRDQISLIEHIASDRQVQKLVDIICEQKNELGITEKILSERERVLNSMWNALSVNWVFWNAIEWIEKAKESIAEIEARKQEPYAEWKVFNKGGSGQFGQLVSNHPMHDGLKLYVRPVPAQQSRELLRAIVDATWGHAYESEQVPSADIADKIINSVLSKFAGEY